MHVCTHIHTHEHTHTPGKYKNVCDFNLAPPAGGYPRMDLGSDCGVRLCPCYLTSSVTFSRGAETLPYPQIWVPFHSSPGAQGVRTVNLRGCQFRANRLSTGTPGRQLSAGATSPPSPRSPPSRLSPASALNPRVAPVSQPETGPHREGGRGAPPECPPRPGPCHALFWRRSYPSSSQAGGSGPPLPSRAPPSSYLGWR